VLRGLCPGKEVYLDRCKTLQRTTQRVINFVNYICRLEYKQQPNYNHWKQTFHVLLIRLGHPPNGCFNLTSSRSSHTYTQQVQLAASQEQDLSANQTEADPPPVVKGQYVLVQILPCLIIEGTPSGRGNDSVDRSHWHDPLLAAVDGYFHTDQHLYSR